MTNALTIYGQFDQLQRAALALHRSGYFNDSKSEAQAIVKVMAGAELGLPPFAAMTGIHIIQGKPVLGANVIATLVKNDPRYDYRVKQADTTACVLEWYENGARVGEAEFTMKEAQSAGLASKDNWKKYASDMLFARAISRGARRFAPGIFGGAPVYTPDEMGADVDEEGNVVNSYIVPRNDFDQTNPAADNDFNQDLPSNGRSLFQLGDEVLVRGKNDEKPGTIIDTNGGELFTVAVDGKELKVGADKLTLIDMS